MEKIPCTVGILTLNSGETLRRALESVKEFEEVVLCDGGSIDDTLTIAAFLGCRVIAQDPAFQNTDGSLRDYAGVRNQCLDAASYDWFLYIDSDEVVTPELVAEIRSIVTAPEAPYLVYNVSPRIVLDGHRVEHSSNYPGWQKRFFNRASGARFRKAVHERIGYDEARYPAGTLKGHWLYFISRFQDGVKNRKYARMDAMSHVTKDLPTLLGLVARRFITLLKTSVKIAYNLVRYGRSANLPFALEYTRIQYHLYFLKTLIQEYFKRS